MTAASKTPSFRAAAKAARENPTEAIEYGIIVMEGMIRLTTVDKFTADGGSTYRTWFPDENGENWEIEIRKKRT